MLLTPDEKMLLNRTSPMSLSSAQEMALTLQTMLNNLTELDQTQRIEICSNNALPQVNETISITDQITGNNVTIINSGGSYYIDGCLLDDINSQDGYKILSYQIPPIRDKFLAVLEQSYYQRCSSDKLLTMRELADRGFIHEAAKHPEHNLTDQTIMIQCSVFNKQSSFLHFAIKTIDLRVLQQIISNAKILSRTS